MAIYLIDRKYSELSLDLVKRDENPTVVLIQDGVYLDPSVFNEVYLLEDDVKKRGMGELPGNAKQISYDQLIEMMETEKIYNFI